MCLLFTCWVRGGGFEVVLGKEGFNILVVFLFIYDNHVFPLSACLIIVLFLSSLLCMFFAMCICRLCVLLMCWLLRICESFLAVMKRYASWILGSSSLIAFSGSRMSVVRWVVVGCCMLYCIPWLNSSSVVKLMFVRLWVRGWNVRCDYDSRVCGVCVSLLVDCPVFCSICCISPSLLAGCYLLLLGCLSNRLTMWMRILSGLSIVARLVCSF